jgi:hypothetical protein
MPATIRSRHFVGRIEQVTLNNDKVGLWNIAGGECVHGVVGAEGRSQLRSADESTGRISNFSQITNTQAYQLQMVMWPSDLADGRRARQRN